MFRLKTLRLALLTFALAMVVNLALPDMTFAKQGRGRFKDKFKDKKAEKFINGHDARDGRWDGRGPRVRFRDRRDRDEWFRFRDRRDREERRRAEWRREQMRRAEWRQNELRRRRTLPYRRF
jgi:hypothetical protein